MRKMRKGELYFHGEQLVQVVSPKCNQCRDNCDLVEVEVIEVSETGKPLGWTQYADPTDLEPLVTR